MPWDIWLIFFVLAVIVPWRGRARLQILLAKPKVEPSERLSLYCSTIVFQWLAVIVTAWRAWAHGFTMAQLGLVLPDWVAAVVLSVMGAAFLAAFQIVNLRRVGGSATPSRGRLQALAARILPQSRSETIVFLALAATAGLCEEFLYRGFAMAVFSRAGLPIWAVVGASAILFGLAHLYQGRGGFLGTAILGIVFGVVRVIYGSLLPVVAWHAAVDIVAGIAGPKYLIHSASDTRPETQVETQPKTQKDMV